MDHFVLIDKIISYDQETITGVRHFSNDPCFHLIEALAQLGALHLRFYNNFQKHAFLLSIKKSRLPVKKKLNGTFQLFGKMQGKADNAFSYTISYKSNAQKYIENEFLFATVPYSSQFNKTTLETHYRKVFACLQNDLMLV